MTKLDQMRQYISNFVGGENFDTILGALADQFTKGDNLSIAITDQLTISTSNGVYLDKNLAAKGIVRPADLGMGDLAFKQMGIQINQAKQITEAIHTVLATFYGDESVRASVTSGIAGPYSFQAGDDLSLMLEDNNIYTLTLIGTEFENIQNATTEELADIITRFIRSYGFLGYAKVFTDVDTGFKYVQIFGGAKGPYSFISVVGGSIQSQLEFPDMRATYLTSNTTIWEITRNIGSTHRFRWISGPQPLLSNVLIGDKVLMYGQQFEAAGFHGTFDITGIRLPQTLPSYDSGFFEIQIDTSTLVSSAPNVVPPTNIPNVATYTIQLAQGTYQDLKFYLPKKSTPYNQKRYSLAWEPTESLLKIYMPAVTNIVERSLIGSAHLHLLYGATELNGAFGSSTVSANKIQITGDRTFKYPQLGYDCIGGTGTVTYGATTLTIDYIFREMGYTHVVTVEPHGLTGTVDSFNRLLSNTIVSVIVTEMQIDDPINKFLGPYMVDSSYNYTLTNDIAISREMITQGDKKFTLLINGVLPNTSGYLLFSLSQDIQEGPVKYLASQQASSTSSIAINTISQFGTVVTVTTSAPHGLIIGQTVFISGTTNFNNSWTVATVPSIYVYTFIKSPALTIFETTGLSTPVVSGVISTLILDSSYTFKYNQPIGADITLISDTKAYTPSPDGSDYSCYITGTAQGRIFAQDLMTQITALGINLEIIIIYPNDVGWANAGDSTLSTATIQSDVTFIYGSDT